MTLGIPEKLRAFFGNWKARIDLARRLSRKTPTHGWQRRRIKVVSSKDSSSLIEIWKMPRVTLRVRFSAFHESTYADRLPVAIYAFVLTKPSVTRAVINIHDSGDRNASDQIAFSSNSSASLLIPDPDYFNNKGYQHFRDAIPSQRPWHEREDMIVWRGSTTGTGRVPDDPGDYLAADVLPRLRLCAVFKPVANADVKIYQCPQKRDPARLERELRQAGLFGEFQQPHDWLHRKFAIDIDGNSNAWSNLFTRLLMGCCVIKVSSPKKFRQWYYDRLEPWKNFVPVRSDLVDLIEKIEWCRAHEEECARIASAGQELARAMTVDAEMQDAVRRINERLG